MRAWIVDTGPLVAYLDARDPAHPEVAETWDAFRGRLVTSSAVVTEAMHFAVVARAGPRQLAQLVAASNLEVYDFSQPPELREAALLMEKYADTPMDYADATLVLLAESLEIDDVFSLDQRGFLTYRTRAGRSLRLVLDV